MLYHSKAIPKAESFQPFWWTGFLLLLSIVVFVVGDFLPVSGWWAVLFITGSSIVFEWNRLKRRTYAVQLLRGKKVLELTIEKKGVQFYCKGPLQTFLWWTYEFDPSGGKHDARSSYVVLLRIEGIDGNSVQFSESYGPWKSAPQGMGYSHLQLDNQLPIFEMDHLANFQAVIREHQLSESEPPES
ncbi:hypothetical protein [Phaeodactylibacter sp.]|uniref:hypothetical protein n=1 Tax=Phaeodactylibacter sp. TaxID=1940289 RepID=UPI0025E99742|nr:hypothetical protein [Phaeodactylibacter sp.]MCI4647855.1 hypothetical protein [Phaeodactylibacter sp.]MCI5089443.1 hypothetical protein [Phaeodactylibacter sp.]